MQITLKQRDVELALKMYLASQGIALEGRTFEVDYLSGRKDNGLTAFVDIGPAESLTEAMVKAVVVANPIEVQEVTIPDSIRAEAAESFKARTTTPTIPAVIPAVVVAEELVEEDEVSPAPWMTETKEAEPEPVPVVEAPSRISLFA